MHALSAAMPHLVMLNHLQYMSASDVCRRDAVLALVHTVHVHASGGEVDMCIPLSASPSQRTVQQAVHTSRVPHSILRTLTRCLQMQFCVLSDRYAYRFAPKLFAHPTSIPQVHLAQKLTSILALMMSGGIAWAIGFMLFWHTYLVLTAQGTIDFYNNRMDAYEARQLGHTWINVYDNGCVQNWKHRFDVDGALWWIRWTLPRVRPRRGNGCVFPICVDPRRFAAQAV